MTCASIVLVCDIDRLVKIGMTMINVIKKAIVDDVFVPYFQPIICMNKQICVGCEILIRWSKPLPGITGAEQLISLAVSDGIIFH